MGANESYLHPAAPEPPPMPMCLKSDQCKDKIGHLETRSGQQVTVTDCFPKGMILESKSAQEGTEHEVTFYERHDKNWVYLAFSFQYENKYWIPEVTGKSLKLTSYVDGTVLKNKISDSNYFKLTTMDNSHWCALESQKEPGMYLGQSDRVLTLFDQTQEMKVDEILYEFRKKLKSDSKI